MQIKLGKIGEVITGLEDLNQEIFLILSTPLGSVPHRPTYGSRIYEYLDKPMNIAKPLILAEAWRALRKNSERFLITDIKLKSAEPGKFVFVIKGIPQSKEVDEEVVLEVLADFTTYLNAK
jgi:phage baseplate assembly protein W